jgi:hypothetical protein
MVRVTGIVFLILISTAGVFAQSQDSYDYVSEFNWGVSKNSSGGLIGGFVFKKAKKVKDGVFQTYGLEIMNVKHPLESRRSSNSGNFFIFGKTNYLYSLRFQYGRDFIIFTKAPQQGVEIKAVFAAGPSIGIVTPYYIERAVAGPFSTVTEPYDPNNQNHSFQNIVGSGGFLEGIGQAKIQPGANIKAALNFEMGVLKSSVTGFEAGFLLDAYAKPVPLMASAGNKAFFPTVFITIFYGNRK